MNKCPHCNEPARTRRRNSGGLLACPHCQQPIYTVKVKGETIWTANGTDASALVNLLEELIRHRPGMKHFSFGGRSDKSRHVQIGIAKLLLRKCSYDQRLTVEIIEAYCNGDRRLYPPKSMQGVIGKQFPTALAIAKWNLEQKHIERNAQRLKVDAQRDALSHVEIFMPI